MADKICAFPHCGKKLYVRPNIENEVGVCRDHIHKKPYCQCRQCKGGVTRSRIKTRDELRKEGLLP